MRRRCVSLLGVVAAASACKFDGQLVDGYQCPTGECPAGQVCRDGICVVDGDPPDAEPTPPGDTGVGDGPAEDASPIDAPGELGLVAWWRFESSPQSGVEDATGNGHTGSCEASACPGQATGRIGAGYDFAGDDYIRVPGGGDLAAMTEVTVAGWVFLRSAVNQTPLSKPFHVSGAADVNSWQYEVDAPAQGCLTGPSRICTADVVAFDQWQHFAAVWDGTDKRLYLDGTLVLDTPAILRLDDNDVVIGADYHLDPDTGAMTSAFVFTDGIIDEVRIYDRVLSPAEIAALASP
jgi:hypothetical protein